ncbi:MAG: uracil-DNA glycosylase [Porphyromonas sp.]|nr:uracil-DNA glycosylase [Porphyromonas sp.]
MDVKIESSWKEKLKGEFASPYFQQIVSQVKTAYGREPVAPAAKNIFRAFDLCPFHKVKVVILGQDPYHTPGVADGLAFSTAPGSPIPPSLKNIFKELSTDLDVPEPVSGDLTHWAEEGVFLLNSILTVRQGEAASHSKMGWEIFTDRVIEILSREREHLVFILWGSKAGMKQQFIDTSKHYVIKSAHPSPLSAHYGFWKSEPFSKANYYLIQHGIQPVKWVE